MKPYDLVLVAHEKDFNNIKFIVQYAQKNLKFDSIHLILSERAPFEDYELLKTLTDKPIYVHPETSILKVDKTRIRFRPNWIYQMLLKLFQNVTANDNYLILEADCLILKNLEFFEDDKTTFYLGMDQNHQPYFNFNRLFGFGREYNHSFISDFMMYDKKLVKDLLTKTGCNSVDDFLELIYRTVTDQCYPADYELYGNFCYKYHTDKVTFKHVNYNFSARDCSISPNWSDEEIQNLIKQYPDKESISFHTWGAN
jgi:hypothetical protein